MQYNVLPPVDHGPRVATIIDLRELSPWVEGTRISLSEDISYISHDGDLEGPTGGYEGYLFEDEQDYLLAQLDDGTRVVTNRDGLERYMRGVGQSLPADLPS
jgi:hypothetical protein